MSSVPVSQYEALRAEMRSLVQQAQQVQEIATQVISTTSASSSGSSTSHQIRNDESELCLRNHPLDYTMESLVLENTHLTASRNIQYEPASAEGDATASEDECGRVPSTQMSVSSEPISHTNRPVSNLYHGTWPVEKTMWNSEPTKLSPDNPHNNMKHNVDQASVLSFASSSGGVPLDRVLGSPDRLTRRSMQQLEAKVDMVYSLLAMLGGQEHADMGDTLLALSTSPESCLAMRQSGCIPLLVQLVQSDKDLDTRKKASQALHNLVYAQPDEKLRKRETRVLKLLEQARAYTEALKNNTEFEPEISSSTETQENGDNDKHPVPIIANLMKHSFDEGHRQAICQLGGIHIIASLVETEHTLHGSTMDTPSCILLRRYACMALTNLTFGDSGNKALLCSFREFMRALVIQLQSPSDELRQVTASVLRNLSWRADQTSQEIVREVGTVAGLMKAGMATTKENTLKSILSALWNLSAHCTENKLEICAVESGLGFLVDMLSYKAPSKSLTINENAGGILRNISSQIAVRDDYREILRKHNCLQILLEQLKSPSLTIVSNACGTLWNLSAKNQVDQEALWQMGAPAMLRSLNHSKHKMIATGSSAALKNLLNSRPSHSLLPPMDSTARSMDLPVLPTLGARKQKALMRDLDQNLSETFENLERDSPTKVKADDVLIFERTEKYIGGYLQKRTKVSRSESHEFMTHTEEVQETRKTRSETSTQNDLCNGFSSLNLGEPSTSYQKELRNSKGAAGRLMQGYSPSSLVYMNSAPRKIRNNYSDTYPDDIDTSEQPIDYSRKYSDTKPPNSTKPEEPEKRSTPPNFQYNGTGSKLKEPVANYGIYAETDLDQPTDYSLRYAEDDSDSDICVKITKDNNEFVQDTVKTYCTEGTPLNFSTATSMSDLRIDVDKNDIDNDKSKDKAGKTKIPALSHLDEKDHCSVEDISDIDNRQKCNEKSLTSQLSSGLMSPEKPVNYCEEGTPGYFSRVSSFGSLNSIPVGDSNVKVQTRVPSTPSRNVEEKVNDVKVDSSPGEAKVVKFVEPSSNCAEQTPLMFSRSSSLGSLDSVEQHSIHDDRSSVISDFSRLTSGIVSPSELPDSPTQTVPPSPRPRKGHLEYPSTSRNPSSYCLRGPDGRPQPAPRSIQKPSVFEDNLTKFKEESTPVQFSTATSISSLTIDDQDEPVVGDLKVNGKHSTKPSTSQLKEEGSEKQDTEQEKRDSSSEFNEQLSENDEDEDILADCINIGMQNNRHRLSKPSSPPVSKIPSVTYKPLQRGSGIPLPRTGIPSRTVAKPPPRPNHSDSLRTYCTEDTPAVLSHAGSNSDLSVLSMQTDNKSKRDYLSDDSSNLSGDNDNILAECIQSGMPKAKTCAQRDKRSIVCPGRNLPTSTPIKPFARGESSFAKKSQCLPSHLGAKDEVNSFAVENSPCQFSLRSSLSDLTVDGSTAGLARTLGEGETSPESTTGPAKNTACPNENRINLSRQESLSSLSVESFGSIETEQALLEQCISSGMPKSKHNVTPGKPQEKEKPIGVATKHFNPQKNLEIERCRRLSSEKESGPKNVNVASAAGNTSQTSPGVPPTAAGVETTSGLERSRASPRGTGTSPDSSRVRSSRTEENLSTGLTKSGCEKSLGKILDDSPTNSSCSNSDNCVNMEKVDAGTIAVDNRMLDPDAMIESLDRFTAELVSQASSHLQQKEENKFVTSVTEGDTWNEDLSPNDLTFPSISGSAPNVITFESSEPEVPDEPDDDELDEIDGINGVEQPSNDFSSLNTSTMTESTLIAMEATRMATTFQQEAELCQSINSLASLELDQVQPPSQLNSLTSSGLDVMRSPKVVRKRSLPASLMVRRALSNSLNQGSSLESLENHSLSNLDQVNPPSAMGEVLDMDGSMVSVASINSEAEDYQPKADKPNSIFTIRQPSNLHHLLANSSNANSLCDLDNVNPPSLFNEITDMCNSLADVTAENVETELFEDCTLGPTENEITEFSDANSTTPIQTDMSSADSTPTKKVKSLNKQLTPKQRRHLAKERYKTYTVAAEMVMREEEQKLNDSKDDGDDDDSATEDYRTVACDTETYKTAAEQYSTATFTRSAKTTPKERRQMDQARFQTQVLEKSVVESLEAAQPTSNGSSPEPTRSKLSIRRSFVQKRLENRDRFKTQTITEASLSPPPPPNMSANDLHYMVQREANKVLKTLGETKSRPDELLDCETLSLVSNDDDSEHNSGSSMNYRTYHKSWGLGGNNIPVIQPASPGRISSDLENHHPGGPAEDASSDRSDSEDEAGKQPGKPKIVKPSNKVIQSPDDTVNEDETQNKGIRGRRKPLYSKANLNNKMAPRTIKPIKTVTSNLVKNVTSSLKSSNQAKTTAVKQSRNVIAKPPIPQSKGLKAPSNYNKTSPKYGSNTSNSTSPKGSPVRSLNNKTSPKHTPETPKTNPKSNTPSPLERQGTFTKEDKPKSKIPSAIPKASSTSRIAKPMAQQKPASKPQNVASSRSGLMKSASADRAHKPSSIHVYNRSPSADGRERSFKTSPSSQSLKNGTVKKNPEPTQRSSSSSSLASNNSSKQITSRIANLWKKVEESKKQPPKKDGRIWIQNKKEEEPTGSEAPRLIRSSTFENKESLLIKNHAVTDETKRLSRLGSFLVMDEDEFTNTEELSF